MSTHHDEAIKETMNIQTKMRLIKEAEKEEEGPWIAVFSYIFAVPIMALCLLWYNHVLFQWNVAYWQWMCISVVMLIIPKWIRMPVFGIIFTLSALGQICYWIGLTTLPLVKLVSQ